MSDLIRGLTRGLPAAALVVFGLSSPAHAILTLSLDDGGGSTVVTDDDGDGKVAFDGALSAFTTNISAGFSKPILTGTPTLIDLVSANVSNGSGTLVIELSDTDFTKPTGYLVSALGGTTNGTLTYEAFVNAANGDPFAGSQIALKTLTDAAFSAGSRLTIDLTDGSPYSLGIRVTINHQGAPGSTKITSFDSEIKIPEPGSLGLLGTGLVLSGLMLRRRRRRDA